MTSLQTIILCSCICISCMCIAFVLFLKWLINSPTKTQDIKNAFKNKPLGMDLSGYDKTHKLYEPKAGFFKEGDIVYIIKGREGGNYSYYHKHTGQFPSYDKNWGRVFKVLDIYRMDDKVFGYVDGHPVCFRIDSIRRATPEEIAMDLENRNKNRKI